MWKLFRTGAIVALLALGALKLAQHFAARGAVERLAASSPSIRIGYGDISGALDGSVLVDAPSVEVLAGPARGTVLRAARATLEPDGVFWLIKRALTGDTSVPARLAVRLAGVSFANPALDGLGAEGWFGSKSLVPFETLGCGDIEAFAPRDYARMGLAPSPHDAEIRYAFDAAEGSLRLDVVATGAPFATISTHLELAHFAPPAWLGDAGALARQRIEQLSLTYSDGGYLARRNRYCAHTAGVDDAGFLTRHRAAVDAFLARHGVAPGDEVERLYRALVAGGGSVELSSLPDAAFVAADYAAYPPEDLLRLLNVTLRRDVAPPILLRLAFTTPEEAPKAAEEAADTAVAVESPPAPTPAPAPVPDMIVDDAAAPASVPLMSTAYAASVPIPVPTKSDPPLLSRAEAPAPPLASDDPDPATPLVAEPEAKAVLPGSARPRVDPRVSTEAIPPSAPPPPPDSTAALVWSAPTIERLPSAPPERSPYMTIALAELGAHVGDAIRVVTTGGKEVEGRLRKIDATYVVLVVRRDGGAAELRIPRSGIRRVELRRAASSG